MIRSGANVYILYTVLEENWYTSQGHLYLASSNDGGVSFNPRQRVNVASTNGGYYLNTIQDVHYSPNLASIGNNVYVTWVNTEINNFDSSSTRTLRVRRSTDKGVSLEAPITLAQPVISTALPSGQETIVADGNNVYVVTVHNGGTYLWRSTDSGSSFEAPRKISDGGWWPSLITDPNNSAKLHLTNGYYVTSTDFGASFKGVLTLQPTTLGGWWAPILAIGSDGVIHYAASGSRYNTLTTQDNYYRRLAPASAASGPSKILRLAHDSALRSDNMQVAASPDINLTRAMTIEFWFRKIGGGEWPNYQVAVSKTRASGSGTFECGLWNSDGHIYTRLVTEGAANQTAGDWLGSGINGKDDVWNHIAVTYDANGGANNWKIYVDGVLANSATLTGNMVMDNMPLLLRGATGNGSFGTMEIANFRIWNRARSGVEIQADMNSTLIGTESGLMAYYTFSDTTRDITGHGNDGVFMYKESFISTTGALIGQVLNSESLTSVSDITVKAKKGTDSFTTITDVNGNFSFNALAAGNYVIELISPSYWSNQHSATINIDETTQLKITGIPQTVVSDIRNGWVTQAQSDQAVSTANAAKDLIITQKDEAISTLNTTITSQNQTIASMFTQQQLNQAVAAERTKWDVNNDGKMGLEEVIYILQKVAGVR